MVFKMASNKEQWREVRETPLVFFLMESGFGLFFGIVGLLFASVCHNGLEMVDLWFKYMDLTVFLLNILPPFLVFWFFLFLSRKPIVAYSITAVFTLVLAVVNFYKISLRNEPFLFRDFGLIFELKNIASAYTFHFSIALFFLVVALVLMGALQHYALPFSYVPPISWKHSLISAGGTGLLFFLIWGLFINSETVYEKTQNYTGINRTAYSEVYLSRGMWYPFLNSTESGLFDMFPTVGEVDGVARAYEILEDFPPDPDGLPMGDISVIAIMLEGFCDYSDFDLLSQEKGVLEVYEPWHRLSAEGVSGNVINTVFGGGTAYTERSFLTGVPGADDKFDQLTNSYVWMFQKAGYYTHGAHIGFEDFYQRITVNKNLGFQEYFYYEDTYADLVPEDAMYANSDTIFFDSIISQVETAWESHDATFGFYVTIQNHGPYSAAADMSNAYISKAAGLDEEHRAALQTYLIGVEDTLNQVDRLVDYLNQQEKPVMLVLFGDHMPWAGGNESILHGLGASLDTSTIEGMLNFYGTPYLILANEAAQGQITGPYPAEGGDISNHFLMNKLFETVGWQAEPEIGFSSYVMSQLPVVFRTWEYAYWYQDEVTVTLPKELQEWASIYASYVFERRATLYNPDG